MMGSSLPAGEPSSGFFDASGVKIHYLVQGEGEPVVLIHALHSSALINWRLTGVMDELARDHRVIVLDLPGHGRSDRPERGSAYGLQLVEDVILLMDHLHVKRAHVVGYSLGGMVGMKLIATHPDRVISATIGGMGWFREGSALQEFWRQMPARPGAPGPPSAFVERVPELALSQQELDRIKVPVEIIIGDRDPVRRLYVDGLRRARKDWPVVELQDAGHVTCIVKPRFKTEIAGWVRGHPERKIEAETRSNGHGGPSKEPPASCDAGGSPG
jgi:pimeloyl-ACP methyl ester carboxylesterase